MRLGYTAMGLRLGYTATGLRLPFRLQVVPKFAKRGGGLRLVCFQFERASRASCSVPSVTHERKNAHVHGLQINSLSLSYRDKTLIDVREFSEMRPMTCFIEHTLPQSPSRLSHASRAHRCCVVLEDFLGQGRPVFPCFPGGHDLTHRLVTQYTSQASHKGTRISRVGIYRSEYAD